MTIYIGFNKKSSLTAKNLKEAFATAGEECRTINRKRFKKKPSVFIRWGNSYTEAPEGAVELNSLEAVKNASNKLLMAITLIKAEGVNFPKCYFNDSTGIDLEEVNILSDVAGRDLYYRNKHNIVRRRANYVEGDLYATEPIDRAREFRVHVFNGRTIGVYEKIPHDPDQYYCKNDNCDFVRLDMSSEDNRHQLKGVRPQAVAAVNSLGLLFGGVDVIIDKEGVIYVNEVNSAPSLNSLNVDRFKDSIINFINESKNETTGDTV